MSHLTHKTSSGKEPLRQSLEEDAGATTTTKGPNRRLDGRSSSTRLVAESSSPPLSATACLSYRDIQSREIEFDVPCPDDCRDSEYKEAIALLIAQITMAHMKFQPGIALNERSHIAKIEAKAARDIRSGAGVGFFEKPIDQKTHQQRYRNLLLEFIIKTTSASPSSDKRETKALFSFVSPSTKKMPRKILMGDLKPWYEAAEIIIGDKCPDHIQ
jgi:hypothetical protein